MIIYKYVRFQPENIVTLHFLKSHAEQLRVVPFQIVENGSLCDAGNEIEPNIASSNNHFAVTETVLRRYGTTGRVHSLRGSIKIKSRLFPNPLIGT